MSEIKKEYLIKANIEKVFKALTDPIEIEYWSGAPAIMESLIGGKFSLWGGSILGINVLIEENKIVQDWKESKWQDYSNVMFELENMGHKTLLKLEHSNIPVSSVNDIDNGWDDHYLNPLKSYLEQ